MRLKKALSWVLALALSFSLAAPALAADTSFTDVKPGAWYYNNVAYCVEHGLMQGMGDGTFAPDSVMTAAQFITVAVTAVYPDQAAAEKQAQDVSAPWWKAYYTVARDKELIIPHVRIWAEASMNDPITRQEMAMIASRITLANGESMEAVLAESIPDYDSVGQIYRADVLNAYSKGIILGVDDDGTFDPTGVLTRAQACSVIQRMLDPNTRFGSTSIIDPVTGAQTWVEGQRHLKAKAGDVVIKADGTRVTLRARLKSSE